MAVAAADTRAADAADLAARRAGLRILVPGYPQWSWSQRERGLVLFGSFAAALAVGVFLWGTRASSMILAFAIATHIFSAADAIRQSAFPGFGRGVALSSASAGLGLGLYGPVLALGLLFAWPGYGGGGPNQGYLVNRGAFWGREPASGDWAWVVLPGRRKPQAVRVLAGPGQSVEWSASGLRVAGLGVAWTPPASAWRPREVAFTVPPGQALVAPEAVGRSEAKLDTACGLVLVETRRIGGEPWARFYPIWQRALLH